jgi:hypothetical protein
VFDFHKACIDRQDWIVATPFSYQTQGLLQASKQLGIKALVIIYDIQINAGGYYPWP